jgi:hypothetical protein
MRAFAGLAIAFGLFAVSFALHIVGGRLDQGWLFATAVVLIYVFATGFPAVSWIAAGARGNDRVSVWAGSVAGVALTVSALWAANDRSFAWWQWPAAPALVVVTSTIIIGGWWWIQRRRQNRRGTGDPAVSSNAGA